MTERNRDLVTKEIESFLSNLNNQVDAARELLVDMIDIADSSGRLPKLFFVEDPRQLGSRRAVVREQKALFLGFSYQESGRKKAVVLMNDGKILSTEFENVYRIRPAEYSRHKTKSTLERVQYSTRGEALTGIDFLYWFPTASAMLADLIRK